MGFSFFDSRFLALAMSITSTVVTVRILEELGMIKDKSTVLILGITIVEDIIAITTLGIFQSVAREFRSSINSTSLYLYRNSCCFYWKYTSSRFKVCA